MLIIMKHYFAQSRSFEQNPATPALLSSLSASCAIFLAAFCALTSSIYSSRPAERSGEDVDIIMARLKNVKAFERFHPSLLHQICLCGFYECLEKGITREPPDCFSSKSNICCSEEKQSKFFPLLPSVSSRRHRHQLVHRPLRLAGCQSLRDFVSPGR